MVVSRRGRLIFLAGATVLLALAGWATMDAMARLGQARMLEASLHAERAQLQSQLPMIERREAYVREAEAVKAMAGQLGIDPAQWTNRRVQRTASLIGRQDAETLLIQQFGAKQRQWFAAEHFDVAVTSPMAGLFTPPPPDDRGFNLEMAGVVYFPFDAR
ncbi:MAG: hypothetical protein ACLGG8_10640 [Gammaproteobacteria bacterium]